MKKNKVKSLEKVCSIPFVKPVRVGNFKLWRSKITMSVEPTEERKKDVQVESDGRKKAKSQKISIECINVSNLDGSFSVRIPQTYEMFGMLTVAYGWMQSEVEDERKRGEGFIRTSLSNIFYVSSICNGFYHHGIEMLTTAYAMPSVLSDSEDGRKFSEDVRETVSRFLEWRAEYERQMSGNEPTDEDLHQEEIAEQAVDILNGK